jgi:hypothetical protein
VDDVALRMVLVATGAAFGGSAADPHVGAAQDDERKDSNGFHCNALVVGEIHAAHSIEEIHVGKKWLFPLSSVGQLWVVSVYLTARSGLPRLPGVFGSSSTMTN